MNMSFSKNRMRLIRRFFSTVVLALCWLSGCSEPDLEQAYREAAARAKAGSFETAVELTEACLKRQPGNINLLILHGFCMFHLGEQEEAIGFFKQAAELDANGDNALAQYFYGWALYEVGRFGDAIWPLERAYRNRDQVAGLEPVLLVMLGRCCSEQNLTRGLGYLQALRRYPEFVETAEVYNSLGILQLKQGEYEPALASFLAARKLAPANPTILQNIAVLYYQYLGNPGEAMRYYRYTLAARQRIKDSTHQADVRRRLGQLVRLLSPQAPPAVP